MKIHLPDDIRHYEPELRFFFDMMVRKLHINRHKGFCEDKTLQQVVLGLDDERAELSEAITKGAQFDIALESVDVANFAFLVALASLRMSKGEFENGTKS